MPGQRMAKRERVVEAVRRGLEGDGAVEFIHRSGFAMTSAGIARHLRSMGGRGRVQELVEAGKSNHEILRCCFPQDDEDIPVPEPAQGELFEPPQDAPSPLPLHGEEQFETTKVTVRMPRDVYTALRIASRVEGKPQNQLIVEILTAALSRMPRPEREESDAGEG